MPDMLGRAELIPLYEAYKLLDNAAFKAPETVEIPLEDACGAILAETVTSPEDVPQFARSTMDGYVLRAEDTFGASETLPAYIKVINEVFMGKAAAFSISHGEAAKIPTGGMLPEGADAVLMFEHAQPFGDSEIEVLKALAPADNVIQKGQDIGKGELLLRRGHVIRPQDMGALAACGLSDVRAFKRPIVSIISTGDEIVPPGKALRDAEVRDVNSYNLSGLLQNNGAVPVRKGIYKDDFNAIHDVVSEAVKTSQMVLITGGSSVGTLDMTARIIDGLGRPGVLFHGVAVKPGKPLIAGAVNGVPVFGLPGHPAAVTVSFEIFIKRVLRRLTGEVNNEPSADRNVVTAKLKLNIASQPARTDFIWVKILNEDGQLYAQPILSKSGLINSLVKADGVIEIPADRRGLQK
ncbi:MAG: molybdopterin molybdotransferase MoeA, partial [Candidatus Magnetominusculus sp. LBB02]|nr:molybdopterin molybdotransferase MoeA [Candidatus Magnetominusculus sp. LBB02]